eukprot:scaffold4102_cov174-Ochromonas_danica.AAC.1
MILNSIGDIFFVFILLFCLLVHARQLAKITASSINASSATSTSAFWEGDVAYIVGYNSSSSSSFIVRSDDFGLTWQVDQSISSAQINDMASGAFGGVLYRIGASASSQAHVYNNGSANWQTYTPTSNESITYYGASVGSNGVAFLVGTFKTIVKANYTTSFSTWKTVSTAASSSTTWYDVSTYDGVQVIVVGTSGRIYYSLTAGTDNTASLVSSTNSGTTGTIYCVAHGNASVAMAAGANGYVAKTVDGGHTWAILSVFPSTSYTS